MKIVSDYHDYYDLCQVWQSDSNDIFFRKRKQNELGYSTNTDKIEIPQMTFYISQVDIIGFCGKLYPIKVKKIRNIKKYEYNRPWLTPEYSRHSININRDYAILYGKESIINDEQYSKKEKSQFIDYILSINKLKNIFLDKKVPLFVARKTRSSTVGMITYEINYAPLLRNYNFDYLFPAEIAYQEIEMFFSNVIFNKENPDPQITDNIVLRDAKGFDNKSFKHRK